MSFSGEFFSVGDEEIQRLTEVYPGVPVEVELGKMDEWLRRNPARRKTQKGMPRFIGNWLAKTHGRLLEAEISAVAREHYKRQQSRSDASVGLWEGYQK